MDDTPNADFIAWMNLQTQLNQAKLHDAQLLVRLVDLILQLEQRISELEQRIGSETKEDEYANR